MAASYAHHEFSGQAKKSQCEFVRPSPPLHIVNMNNIAFFREARGLNQSELAEMIGVTQSTIQRAETEHKSAKLLTYHKCASALGVTIDQLFSTSREGLEPELAKALSEIPANRIQDVLAVVRAVVGPNDKAQQ